jgi:ketosteroid isomerase-like protein
VWREWEDWRGDIDRVVDLGSDRLAVFGRFRARGHGSGAEVSGRYGQLWSIREGRILRVRTYANPEEALEAAGLRE